MSQCDRVNFSTLQVTCATESWDIKWQDVALAATGPWCGPWWCCRAGQTVFSAGTEFLWDLVVSASVLDYSWPFWTEVLSLRLATHIAVRFLWTHQAWLLAAYLSISSGTVYGLVFVRFLQPSLPERMEMCATSHNLGTDTHTQQTSDGTWWYRLDTACLNSAAPQKTVREALVILEAKGLCQLALVGLHSQTYVNHVIVCYYVTFRWKTMGMRATQMDMAISGLWCTCSFTCVRIWFPLFWGMLWQLPSGKSHGTVRAMLPRELWQTVRPSFLWQVRHATIFRFLRSLSSPQTSPTLMCEWRWKLSKWNQTLSSMPVKRRG